MRVIRESVARDEIPRYDCVMRRADAIARLEAAEADLRRLGVGTLYLFGSVARDEAIPGSDVDIFVEAGEPSFYDLVNYMGSYERLRSVFPGQDVGYATRDGIAKPMRAEIEREAIRVF